MSDPGPRQEVEKAKLSGNRRGVGWVHSTAETLEQSREERWRRGRREGTQSEEEVDAEARSGHSAGFGVSQEAPIRGSNLNGPPKPRTSITFDLRQEPGAGKPCAVENGKSNPCFRQGKLGEMLPGQPSYPTAKASWGAPSSCAAEAEAIRATWAGYPEGYARAAAPVTSAQV